jgi:hypothetical protein
LNTKEGRWLGFETEEAVKQTQGGKGYDSLPLAKKGGGTANLCKAANLDLRKFSGELMLNKSK